MQQTTKLNPNDIFNVLNKPSSKITVDYYNPPRHFGDKGFKASDIINLDLNQNLGLIDPQNGELFALDPSMYNHFTYLSRRSPIGEKPVSLERITEREKKCREILGGEAPYQSLALINGVPAILETNSPHMFNLWSRNWFILGVKIHEEEFGDFSRKLNYVKANNLPIVRLINAIDTTFKEEFEKAQIDKISDPEKRESKLGELTKVLKNSDPKFEVPGAYYSRDNFTIVAINTDYYGQLKSWALGAVSDVGESLPNDMQFHSLHAAAAVVNGKAIAFVAPTGTGKSTQEAMLGTMNEWIPKLIEESQNLSLRLEIDPQLTREANSVTSQYHSDDWLYIDRKHIASVSERHIYPRTNFVDDRIPESQMPDLMKKARDGIFRKALKENVKVGENGEFIFHDSIGIPNSRVIANPADAVSNPRIGLSFAAPLTSVNLLLRFDDDKGIEAVNSVIKKEMEGSSVPPQECRLPYTIDDFKASEYGFVIPLNTREKAWKTFRFVPTKLGPGSSEPARWGTPTFEVVGTKYLAKTDKTLANDAFQKGFYESYGEKLNCSAINIGRPCWIGLGIKNAQNRDWNSLSTDEQELAIKGTAILMAKRAGAISEELATLLIKILQKKANIN